MGDYKYMYLLFVFVTGRQTAAWTKAPQTPIPARQLKKHAGGGGGGGGC